MENDIRKIIEAGIQAPSGENCQPWRFAVEKNQIQIFNLPERDQSLYSWGQRASLLAHGALIENMSIMASALGYTAHLELLPKNGSPNLVAIFALERGNASNNSLSEFIPRRSTNRKAYEKVSFTSEQRDALNHCQEKLSGTAQLKMTEDTEEMKNLASAASVNERILFGNQRMHNFFFSHITWTEKEDSEKRIGFYIKTFELPPPALVGFKLSKSWPVAQFFDSIGLPKFIAKQNAAVYASASAIGVVLISNNNPEEFIAAGRLTQRVWLTVTKLGLSLQPLAGLIFLAHKIGEDGHKDFSEKQVELIRDAHRSIRSIFNVESDTIAMMFRIGRGENPTARALRLLPNISGLDQA